MSELEDILQHMLAAEDLLRRWVKGHQFDGMSGMDGHFDICGGCRTEAYDFSEIVHDPDCLWVKSKEFLERV